MKRLVLFGILVAVIIVVVLVSTLAGGRPQLPPPSSPPPAPITIDASPGEVKAFATALLTDKTRTIPAPFERMSVHPFGDAGFPPDYQIAAATKQDPELEAYARLSSANRTNDIFLFDPLLTTWESEYQLGGRALPFHCNFIVHVAPAGNGATELSVLEYQPQVNRGGRFVIFGKEGPGTYDDIVTVPPTNKDRAALLDFIASEWKKSRG
jgi:hypothetical protein